MSSSIMRIPCHRVEDARGFFIKPITGNEDGLKHLNGEFYITMAHPGQVRGNHYHKKATEWFTVISGVAHLYLRDICSGNENIVYLSAAKSETLVIPPHIAHAFLNPTDASEAMFLSAFSNLTYDPDDTVSCTLI